MPTYFRGHHTRALAALCLLAGILMLLTIPSCRTSDDEFFPPAITNFQGFWQGTYVAAGPVRSGTLVLDLYQHGSTVLGDLVFRDDADFHASYALKVIGSVTGNELSLELDRSRYPYPYTLSLLLHRTDSTLAAGNMMFVLYSLNANVSLRNIRLGTTTVTDSVTIQDHVRSIAVSNHTLWISTSEQFLAADSLHGPMDTTNVTISIGTIGDLIWTSSTLASAGTTVWGDLPASISNGPNYSHILSIDPDGNLTGTFDIRSRTSGLAYDGTALWAYCYEPNNIYRIETGGTFTDSVTVPVPDAIHLEYADGSFWTLGWYTKKLYKIGTDGTLQSVYDLPEDVLVLFPLGIAYDGPGFYYARELPMSMGARSIIYKLTIH